MRTQTSLSRKTEFVARGAILLAVSLILSYLETLIPLSRAIPIPGFKLGLANIAVIIAYYSVSPTAAAVISFSRAVITSLLFSGVTTLIFSLLGAAFSFAVLMVISHIKRPRFGFLGLSVAMALAHNAGQLIGSVIVMKSFSILWYYPALAFAAVICGSLTGCALSLLPERLYKRKVRLS